MERRRRQLEGQLPSQPNPWRLISEFDYRAGLEGARQRIYLNEQTGEIEVVEETVFSVNRIRYGSLQELADSERGRLIREALRQMEETGKDFGVIVCPCCGRKIRVTAKFELEDAPSLRPP